ncbi:MAG: PilZ domain-containing protein [Candidatus Aminicenantes bacterium]|nr:MAG: PilZ domain-containing protein [Candidatus Aminicenantes bacterium]
MKENNSPKDRRRFPRVSSRVYYRIGKSQSLRQRVSNISLAGVRIYSDERLDAGEEVELELYFPNGFSGKGSARVVWIKELPPGSGTSYDVGLEFLNLSEEVVKELTEVLKDKS